MKRILIIKMSALGDIVHTFPAVSDLLKHYPDTEVDWLCEEPFTAVAALHQGVNEVIGHGRLRWKNSRFGYKTLTEQYQFYRKLRQKKYDLVIDAQGRVKSARVGWLSGSEVVGFDRFSATDEETRWLYSKGFSVAKNMNAIERTRSLMAQVFGYSTDDSLDYGVGFDKRSCSTEQTENTLIFFHGTTWDSKHWPVPKWVELLRIARRENIKVLIPSHGAIELQRAKTMIQESGWGELLPQMSLKDMSATIRTCSGAVGVDTGLMHMAVAFGVPTVSVFGSTDTALTGAMGRYVKNVQSGYSCSPCRKKQCPINPESPPCYDDIPVEGIWKQLVNIQHQKLQRRYWRR